MYSVKKCEKEPTNKQAGSEGGTETLDYLGSQELRNDVILSSMGCRFDFVVSQIMYWKSPHLSIFSVAITQYLTWNNL